MNAMPTALGVCIRNEHGTTVELPTRESDALVSTRSIFNEWGHGRVYGLPCEP